MKLPAISIALAIVLAGFAGAAAAGPSAAGATPVSDITGCAPPNDHMGRNCDAFNQMIRANFSRREIGMLFGYATPYPEHRTGGIDRLQKRYQALLREYVAQRNATYRQVAGQ